MAALRATRVAEDAALAATVAATATAIAAAQVEAGERLQAATAARDDGDYTRALAEAREALALQPEAEEAAAFLAAVAPTATIVAESRRAEALATGFGLQGKEFKFCSGGPNQVHFDGVVEQTQVTPDPSGGLRLVVVVRATNAGNREASTGLAVLLLDERGRAFNQAGVEQVDSGALARGFNAQRASQPIRPGFSARTVWPYIVAPDVEHLTFVQSSGWPCDIPGVAFVPTAGRIVPTAGAAGAAPRAAPRTAGAPRATPAPQGAPGPAADPAGPGFGLVGQRLRVTSTNNQPFDIEVERVDEAEHPQGGVRLVVVTRVSNPGTLPTSTAPRLGTDLFAVDERGRRFPEAGVGRGINPDMLAREYDAKLARAVLEPGLSARQVWGFVVAPDVRRLTLTASQRR